MVQDRRALDFTALSLMVLLTALFQRDGTLWAGIGAGLLFAGEFVFIYAGLEHTYASRMVVFIYTTPPVLFWSTCGADRASSARSSAISRRPCSVSATSFFMSWRKGELSAIYRSSYSLKRCTMRCASLSSNPRIPRVRAAASRAEPNTSRTAGTPISAYS